MRLASSNSASETESVSVTSRSVTLSMASRIWWYPPRALGACFCQ